MKECVNMCVCVCMCEGVCVCTCECVRVCECGWPAAGLLTSYLSAEDPAGQA